MWVTASHYRATSIIKKIRMSSKRRRVNFRFNVVNKKRVMSSKSLISSMISDRSRNPEILNNLLQQSSVALGNQALSLIKRFDQIVKIINLWID